MDEGFPFLLVIGVFILAILSRILAGVMDRSRIDKLKNGNGIAI